MREVMDMTVKQRLTRSNVYMFLVPLLIAAMLLILGAGIALYFLETKYPPRLWQSLYEMHMTLEQYETTFSSLEIFIWTYLGAVGMALLLDLMLPGMDGFSICKRLREKLDIPILMVTARTQDVDKIRGLGFGADDYIEKPFSPGVLVARVKANLA